MPQKYLVVESAALANAEPTLARFLDEANPAHYAFLRAPTEGAFCFPIPADLAERSLDYFAGYLQARVNERLGEDLNYRTQVVRNPFGVDGTGKIPALQLALIPGGTVRYRVSRNAGEVLDEQVTTFEQALHLAWDQLSNPLATEVNIVALNADDVAVGDQYVAFEHVADSPAPN